MAKLVCDICGGKLIVQEGGKQAICESCGLAYSMERLKEISFKGTTIDSDNAFANYYELALNALSGNNYKEALKYANRALELNVSDCDMWLVKGEALLKEDAKLKDNVKDALQCFRQARSKALGNTKQCIEQDSNKIIRDAIKLYQKNYVDYLNKRFSDRAVTYFIDSFKDVMIECNIYLREIGIDVINDKYHKEVLKGQINAYQSIMYHYFDSICPCFVSPTINSVDLDRIDDGDFSYYLCLVYKLIKASYQVNHFARSIEEVKNPETPLVIKESQEVIDFSLKFRKNALENIGQVMFFGDDRTVEACLKDEYKSTIGPLPY